MMSDIQLNHSQQDVCTWNEVMRSPGCKIPHLHGEFEILLYDGGGATAFVDSERYDLQAGDAVLIFPGQIHHYDIAQKDSFRSFLVNPSVFSELASTLESSVPSSALIAGASNNPRIKMLTEALVQASDPSFENPYRLMLLRGYLTAILAELLSRTKPENAPRTDSGALRSIVTFCSKNYASDLSLTILEENLGLSKYYISHLFGNKLGLRFNDYVNSLRIFEACKLLVASEDSISAISDAVGFNTLRTFNRAFMKQMGASPSDYRRFHRNHKE